MRNHAEVAINEIVDCLEKNINNYAEKKNLKDQLIEEAGNPEKMLCPVCEREKFLDTFALDRKVPGVKGGLYEISNVWLICSTCNSIKGSKDRDEFVKSMLVELGLKDHKPTPEEVARQSELMEIKKVSQLLINALGSAGKIVEDLETRFSKLTERHPAFVESKPNYKRHLVDDSNGHWHSLTKQQKVLAFAAICDPKSFNTKDFLKYLESKGESDVDVGSWRGTISTTEPSTAGKQGKGWFNVINRRLYQITEEGRAEYRRISERRK